MRYEIKLNTFGIACITLDSYNKEYVEALKKNGFRYYSKTKEWSKPGFTDLERFEGFVLAVFNNDTKGMKKYGVEKEALIKQCYALKKAGMTSKMKYIEMKNSETIDRLMKNGFDLGTATIICEFYKHEKKDFWGITPEEARQVIVKNENLIEDIIDYNKTNNINTCSITLEIWNDGMPF